jgi:integrase
VRKNVSEFLTRKGSGLLGLTFPLHANVSFEKSASFNDMNKIIMKSPYRIYIRDKHAGGKIWWIQNTNTGQRESLETRDKQQALALLLVKNRPHQDAGYHAQMARAHLLVSDPKSAVRTWQMVMDAIICQQKGSTKIRWEQAAKCKPFDLIRNLVVAQTKADDIFAVLSDGKVSTNAFLRRLHNYALRTNWLLAPLISKEVWPRVRHKVKRSITLAEHQQIIEREKNPERRAFYELCWHIGGGQSDVANLMAKDIDWHGRKISFSRMKTGSNSSLAIGAELENVLRSLPTTGNLFPCLCKVREADRATEFKQRCNGLGIKDVTLHSYRYSWAERAKAAGYPERFAQAALGHGSKAVARAYAKNAHVDLPSLENFEREMSAKIAKLGEQRALAV